MDLTQIYEQVHGTKAQGRPDALTSKHLPSRVVGTFASFSQKIRLLPSIPDSIVPIIHGLPAVAPGTPSISLISMQKYLVR